MSTDVRLKPEIVRVRTKKRMKMKTEVYLLKKFYIYSSAEEQIVRSYCKTTRNIVLVSREITY